MDSYTYRLSQQPENMGVQQGTSPPIESRQSVLAQPKQKVTTTSFFNDMNLLVNAPPSASMQQVLHIMVKEITFDKISRDREIGTNSNVCIYARVLRIVDPFT